MKTILIILTFCLTFTLEAYGQQHSIDKQVKECIDDIIKTKGIVTTVDMVECTYKAYEAWNRNLNKYYKLLMKYLEPDEKEKLKAAQRKWIEYRDAELNFSRTMHSNLQGTMYRVVGVNRTEEVARQRALELKAYYYTLIDSNRRTKPTKNN